MEDVTAVILGGGRGTRLYPLTRKRSKPAVPLAGNYRLIDVTVSNCINSRIERIYVLTQFNSASLNQHVSRTYRFGTISKGFVEILAAEQTPSSSNWFQGTADAVRQALHHLTDYPCRDVLILSGDHLYRMDYRGFVESHRESGAGISLAVVPVTASRAPDLGILRADSKGWITELREKPKGAALKEMKTDTGALGLKSSEASRRPYLGSMGIYLFRLDTLRESLERDPGVVDFAREVIPAALSKGGVKAFLFDGYWEDIGTIKSFYEAHIDLLKDAPGFDLFSPEFPLYTHPRFLPGSLVHMGSVENSILNAGCIINKATIRGSIIGLRSVIGDGALIEDSVVLGADVYDSGPARGGKLPALGIGPGAVVKKAIIDTNVRIGRGVILENRKKLPDYEDDEAGIFVRDGIIVISKGAVIPEGTVF